MRPEGSPSNRKRVRFSETPPDVREYVQDYSQKKRRGEEKMETPLDSMEALEGGITAVCLYEGGASLDPASAAAQRARQRKDNIMSRFEEGMTFLGSIEAVEAGYEEPEERFNDAGIPIEPFHLKREREEGYFDEAGNYVEYRTDDVEDNWVESLADVEVDEAWLTRVRASQAAAGGGQAPRGGEDETDDLDPEDLRAYKQRLTELLRPGETTLEALRRLGRHRVGRAGAEGGEGSEEQGPGHHARAKQVMPSPVREVFERLTEYSSLLVEHGEYGIHSQSREAILQSLQAQPPQQEQKQQTLLPAAATAGAAGTAGAGEGAGASGGDAGEALARRLLTGAGAGEGAGGLLLGNDGSGGGDGGESGMVTDADAPPGPAGFKAAAEGLGPGPAPAAALAGHGDQEVDIFADEDEDEGGPAGPAGAAPAPASACASAGAPLLDRPAAVGLGPSAAGAAGGGEAGGGEGEGRQWPGGGGDEEMASADAGHAGYALLDAQSAGDVSAVARGAGALPEQPQGTLREEGPGASMSLEGFQFDPASGYWYNSSLGCYYDASRQLYRDAQSGRWFKWADGQYQPA